MTILPILFKQVMHIQIIEPFLVQNAKQIEAPSQMSEVIKKFESFVRLCK